MSQLKIITCIFSQCSQCQLIFIFHSNILVVLYGKGQRSDCLSPWAQRLRKDAALPKGIHNCANLVCKVIHRLMYVCVYTQIMSGSFMRTQNSIKENVSQYERSDKVSGRIN